MDGIYHIDGTFVYMLCTTV